MSLLARRRPPLRLPRGRFWQLPVARLPGPRLWVMFGLMLLAYSFYPLRIGIIAGASMSPTLASGQIYILDRSYYRKHPLQRRDIIVFRHEGDTMAKRVYALPGDVVVLLTYRDGQESLLVEPEAVASYERLARSAAFQRAWELNYVTIPPGHCFVLGDHRSGSYDSRYFGPVPTSSILGKLILAEGAAGTL